MVAIILSGELKVNYNMSMREIDNRNAANVPHYKMYDVRSVAIATFFGSPIGGGLLMAINYWRLGSPKNSIITMGVAVLGVILTIPLSAKLPEHFPSFVLFLLIFFGVLKIMSALQGPALMLHFEQQGEMESGWKALGIGLLTLIVVFSVLFVFLIVFPGIID